MAIVRAVKSGNWSDPTVWNTGELPTSADDVYSNTFTVTIDVSPTVLRISNAATTGVAAGGGFTILSTGITLTAPVIAGAVTANCLNVNVSAPGTTAIVGNCTAGSGASQAVAIANTSSGTVNITGNCTGNGSSGGTNGFGVSNTSSGIVNITGNCAGGGSGNTGHGANNASTGTINITGNCINGGATNLGANNASTGTLNITGTVVAGSGVGATNASTGTMTHVGTAQASASTAAIGTGVVGQVTILTGPLISSSTDQGSAAASGVNPCIALRWFPADTALSTFSYTMRGATLSGSPSIRPPRVMALPEATSAAYPAANNVRTGTVYGVGNAFTGTCAVPPAGSVAFGVPVDNTTGTAAIDGPSIRAAIGLATANLDTQLDALPTAAENATAIWAAASRTITGGTVDTLTNAPSVPSAAQIASQVRTELTPELERVSNCATVETTGDQIAALS